MKQNRAHEIVIQFFVLVRISLTIRDLFHNSEKEKNQKEMILRLENHSHWSITTYLRQYSPNGWYISSEVQINITFEFKKHIEKFIFYVKRSNFGQSTFPIKMKKLQDWSLINIRLKEKFLNIFFCLLWNRFLFALLTIESKKNVYTVKLYKDISYTKSR